MQVTKTAVQKIAAVTAKRQSVSIGFPIIFSLEDATRPRRTTCQIRFRLRTQGVSQTAGGRSAGQLGAAEHRAEFAAAPAFPAGSLFSHP
jgi:hypothetical protein